MKILPRLLGTLALLPLAACVPASNEASEGPASADAASGKGKPILQADEAPDIDPATGIDRNVTYEPQLGPDPKERSRKDTGKSVPDQPSEKPAPHL